MGELSIEPVRAAPGGNALVVWQPPRPGPAMDGTASPSPKRAVPGAVLRRAVRAAKLALMIWGGVSLTAAGGYAVGKVLTGPQKLQGEQIPQPPQTAALSDDAAEKAAPVLPPQAQSKPKPRVVTANKPDAAKEAAPKIQQAAPKPSVAAAPAQPQKPAAQSRVRRAEPLTNADDIGVAGTGFTRRAEAEARSEIGEPPFSEKQAVVAAPVPRPRPKAPVVRQHRDEPTVTGSIEERWEVVTRPRRGERRFTSWRDRDFPRIRRMPRYIVVR